jgi:hypothetical protein
VRFLAYSDVFTSIISELSYIPVKTSLTICHASSKEPRETEILRVLRNLWRGDSLL